MSSIVASRYAKSVLNLALEKTLEDSIKEDMIFVSDTLQAHEKSLQNVLENPFIKYEKKDKSFVENF